MIISKIVFEVVRPNVYLVFSFVRHTLRQSVIASVYYLCLIYRPPAWPVIAAQ